MAEPKRRYIFSVNYLIFGNGRDLPRKSAFWNMMFSGINALQSAIMLLMVTRICGAEAGGVFAISYATAQLMYKIGGYSCRIFHATDTNIVYTYTSYAYMRVATCIAMMAASLAYCAWRQYLPEKSAVILATCLYTLVEAVEDLDHGELQRRGRLDVAGRVGVLRLLLADIAFFIILWITRDVMLAMMGAVVIFIFVLIMAHRQYRFLLCPTEQTKTIAAPWRLLKECLPLFLSGFCVMYISNAAKYAIDAHLGDEAQTYFSVIFMPIFTINLLSTMVFRPQMKRMAELWNGGKYKEYRNMMVRQIIVIAILAVTITVFGVLIGLRLLGLMYGLELGTFLAEFAVLLIGGGFSALYTYMDVCITIMRKQKTLLVVSGTIGLIALFTSGSIVAKMGLTGACYSYLLLVLLEALGGVMFVTIFYYQAVKRGKGETNK